MEKIFPEGTEDQYVTSTSGESLGGNFHMRRYKRIRKYPQRYEPGFRAAREWKSDTVASIVYMIQDGYFKGNIDTYDILLLIAEWDAEYCMYLPSPFHTREYYVIKYKSHNPDTPTYIENLSGEHADE